MKPHEIKHMAKTILSDKGEKGEPDADDLTGDVEHMSIHPEHLNGAHGFMVEHRMKAKPSKDGNMPMTEGKKHFFPKGDADGLADHVRKVLGGK